jgi:PAS domain S-box-containing protein
VFGVADIIALGATAVFVVVGVLAVLDWWRRRSAPAAAIAVALALLAVLRLLGPIDDALGDPDWPSVVQLVAFAGAGFAILEHRARLFGLATRWRVLAAAGLLVPAGLLMAGGAAVEQGQASALQVAAILMFVVAWIACLVEPATKLWRESANVATVQRAQLRLLASAYVAMAVVILLGTGLVTADETPAGFSVAAEVAAAAIAGVLYLSLKPPAALRRAWLRRRSRDLVEQLQPVGTWQIDPASSTIWFSPSYRRLHGFGPDEQVSLARAFELIHPDDRQEADETFAALLEGQGPFENEYRIVRASDGAVRWVHAQAHALLDLERGRPTALFGTLQDITPAKEVEHHLQEALDRQQEATRQLERLDELKSTILSAVSHELRTPLTALKGFGATLRAHDPHLSVDERRRLSERIVGNAERLEHLLGDLMDLDRLSHRRGALVLERVDLGALVRDVVEAVDPADSHVQLVVPDHAVLVVVDVDKVERAIANLLRNAVDHTPSSASVWVRLESTDQSVEIVVEDDGPGIPDDLKDEVFERFRQGEGPPSRGVGIGLALVREFARLHGGTVWVTDRTGGGASFHLALPSNPSLVREHAG